MKKKIKKNLVLLFLISCSFFVVNAIASKIIKNQKSNNNKPNIVYILADDLGYGDITSYGGKKIKTPHLDELRKKGMQFTQHYSGSAVCAPTRAMLMTGKHSGHSSIRDNLELKDKRKKKMKIYGGQHPLPAGITTIPNMLKKVGYKTACIGKWGLGSSCSSGSPIKQGFDFFYGYNCQRNAHNYYPEYLDKNEGIVKLKGNHRGKTGKNYAPELMMKEIINFVKENKNNPFFLYYATPLPHLPLQVPKKYLEEYNFKETPFKGDHYLGHPKPRAAYAAMVTYMDRNIGKLIQTLKEEKIYDNTLIIFTSDNGGTFNLGGFDPVFFESNKPFRGAKTSLLEGGIRVPMIAVWKDKIKANSTSDHLSAQWDVMATLADLTGAKLNEKHDGISFLPTLLEQKNQKQHSHLYWEFRGQQALRQGDWKIYRPYAKRFPNKPVKLFNLKEDIKEKNNLAGKYPEKVKKMLAIMNNSRTESKISKWNFLPAKK